MTSTPPPQGYVQHTPSPRKRYCQFLDLQTNPTLIAQYRLLHSQAHIWPEILAGIRQVGIYEMEIYLLQQHLVMIVETPLDFTWDEAMQRLASLPRQAEWEAFVAPFQQCSAQATSDQKWQQMERIFHLYPTE